MFRYQLIVRREHVKQALRECVAIRFVHPCRTKRSEPAIARVKQATRDVHFYPPIEVGL
jgi:hypothetical protein